MTTQIDERMSAPQVDPEYRFYQFRVRQLEAEGLDTSDAQAAADAEAGVAPQLWEARSRIFAAMEVERSAHGISKQLQGLEQAMWILSVQTEEAGR